MQHSSDLHLESSDMLDKPEYEQYTFTSATSKHLTRNEQRTTKSIQSRWSLLLLQEQQEQQEQQAQAAQAAQQALELENQQLRLQIQQAHNVLMGYLHQHPGFPYGADRLLMEHLSDLEAPNNPVLWESFPTPSIAPTLRVFEPDGTELVARPLKALLDTDHIHNRVWNDSVYQMTPILEDNNRTIIHMVEMAFIPNNLKYTNEQILAGYRDMFPLAMIHNDDLLWQINKGRWKAKNVLWLPEELDIIRRAVENGLQAAYVAFSTGSRVPSAQDHDLLAWNALRCK